MRRHIEPHINPEHTSRVKLCRAPMQAGLSSMPPLSTRSLMAGGANKKFIDGRERFLSKNVILSPNPQGFLLAKAMSHKIDLKHVSMVGLYDFDLRKDPTKDFKDTRGQKVDTYKLQLLEQRESFNMNA